MGILCGMWMAAEKPIEVGCHCEKPYLFYGDEAISVLPISI